MIGPVLGLTRLSRKSYLLCLRNWSRLVLLPGAFFDEVITRTNGDMSSFAHINVSVGEGHNMTICLVNQQNAKVKAILPGPS